MTASAYTRARLAANGADAQHSTSPTHGFMARGFCIEESEKEPLSQFLAALREQIRPAGALEDCLFQVVVQAAWNLQRIRRHESEMLAAHGNAFLDERLSKALGRLARYKRNLERSHAEAFSTLRTLQTQRALKEIEEKAEPRGAARTEAAANGN